MVNNEKNLANIVCECPLCPIVKKEELMVLHCTDSHQGPLFVILYRCKYSRAMLQILLQNQPQLWQYQYSWKKKLIWDQIQYKRLVISFFLKKYCKTYQTKAGSGNCKTIMNPRATRMTAKLMRMRRQQTPRVFGQNWNSLKNIYLPWFVIYKFFTFKFQTNIQKLNFLCRVSQMLTW